MKYYVLYEYHNPYGGYWEQRFDEYQSYDLALKCIELVKNKNYIRYVAGPLTEFPEKIGMGTKPDPFKFTIIKKEVIGNYTLVLANYNGCTTFGGNKLILVKGIREEFTTFDPHFLEGHFVLARFEPTDYGWEMAKKFAQSLT